MVDSVSTAIGRLRYSVALTMVVFMTMAPFERLGTRWVSERAPSQHPLVGRNGLAGNGEFLLWFRLLFCRLERRRLQRGENDR